MSSNCAPALTNERSDSLDQLQQDVKATIGHRACTSGECTQDSQATTFSDQKPAHILRTGSNQVLAANGTMLRLTGGHTHLQSSAGIATTVPSHDLVIKGGTQDTPQGSGDAAYGEQEQYSYDCSEEPEISWSDAPQTKADKRRKLNRESARRTRVRKQQQLSQFETEATALRSQEVFNTQRIQLLTDRVHDMSTENRRLQLDKQILTQRIGELSVTCKAKEAAICQLKEYIRHAGIMQDIPLPPAEQGPSPPTVQSQRVAPTPPRVQQQPDLHGSAHPLYRQHAARTTSLQLMCPGPNKPTLPRSQLKSSATKHSWTQPQHLPGTAALHSNFFLSSQSSQAMSRQSMSVPQHVNRQVLSAPYLLSTHSAQLELDLKVRGTQIMQDHAQNLQRQQQAFDPCLPGQPALFDPAPSVPCSAPSQQQTFMPAVPRPAPMFGVELPASTGGSSKPHEACMQDMFERALGWNQSREMFAADPLMQAFSVETDSTEDGFDGNLRPFKMPKATNNASQQVPTQQMSEHAMASRVYGLC